MRVLYLGHAYMVAENQKKIAALAQQPGVEVMLVIPHVWHDRPLHNDLWPSLPAKAAYTAQALPVAWAGVEQYHWYRSIDLGMRHFKPDIICVEQGASALVYTQVLIYRNLYAPQAKAAFFTWWNLPYRAKWPLSMVERFNLGQSQGAIAGNHAGAFILREHGFKGPLTVLPQLGVDVTEFAHRAVDETRQRLGLDRFTVGYTGRFVEEKGIWILLEALAGVEFDFQLLMVGRGPLEADIKAFAAQRGWENRLKIVGGAAHSQMALYQNCMDVMVVPSLTRPFWMEQFGHVIIEALACEVPVIGSDSGEVPNVIGQAGMITPEGNAPALQAALTQLAGSAELRAALGKAGRARVLENFTNDQITKKLVSFLMTL